MPDSIVSSDLVQGLLDSSWSNSRKSILLKSLLPYLAYAVTASLYFGYALNAEVEVLNTKNLILAILNIVFTMIQLISMLMQIKKLCHLPSYFLNIMFWADLAAIIYVTLITGMNLSGDKLIKLEHLRTLAAFAIFFILVKIPLYWLRLTEVTEFYVLLILRIIAELKWFLLTLVLLYVATGMPMTILDAAEEKTGFEFLDALYMHYLLMLRLSSVQTTSFLDFDGDHAIVTFIAFLAMTVMIHLVMLNILIAVVANTYHEVQEDILVMSTRSKLEMMRDHSYAITNLSKD